MILLFHRFVLYETNMMLPMIEINELLVKNSLLVLFDFSEFLKNEMA